MVRSTSFGRLASGAILGAALVVGVPASADDGALKGAIEARFQSAKLDRQSAVEVQVESGRATLTGAALTIHARRELERQARKVVGVVDNQVRVLPEERTDRDIRADVSDAILSYPHYTIFDSVELGVADGVVVLRGSVLQPYRKNEIEQRIAKIAGVRAIHNEIAVQGGLDQRRAAAPRNRARDLRRSPLRSIPQPRQPAGSTSSSITARCS